MQAINKILFVHVPNICCINSNDFSTFINFSAMGLASLANECEKNNIDAQILHIGVEKAVDKNFSIVDYVKENNFKIVALSLHWHYQAYDTIEVAQKIKEEIPDVFVVLGGYTASAFPEDILSRFNIDGILKGEGEIPTVALCKELSKKKYDLANVPNLYFKKNNKIQKPKSMWAANKEELDSFNFIATDKLKNAEMCFKNDFYGEKRTKQIFACLGRGCSGNCTWCGGGANAIKQISGRTKVTIRSPKIVAEEFIKLKKEADIEAFTICFDPEPKKQKYAIELFEILGKEMPNEFKITFECFGLPTKAFLDSVKKNLSPNSTIIISPEMAIEELRNYHKSFGFTNKELYEVLDYMEESQIFSKIYFAILPNEYYKETQERDMMIEDLKSRYKYIKKVHAQMIDDFEPFSPWNINPEKYGVTPNLSTFEDYYKHSKGFRSWV